MLNKSPALQLEPFKRLCACFPNLSKKVKKKKIYVTYFDQN